MVKVTIWNRKGGVGKTTSTVNLAYSMAELGKKVLVIDAAPQSNTTAFFGEVNLHSKTIHDVIKNPKNAGKCIYRTKYENIDIIKGCTNPWIDENMINRYWLKSINSAYDKYDVCVIDTDPNFDDLTLSVIYGTDILLTPAYMDNFCRDNLALVQEQLEYFMEKGLVWKIFATKINSRRKAQKNTYLDIMTKHNYPFMNSAITSSSDVENALCMYKPLAKHRKNGQVTNDYRELTIELLEMVEKINNGSTYSINPELEV